MANKVEITCQVCGAKEMVDEPLARWMESRGKMFCSTCHAAGKAGTKSSEKTAQAEAKQTKSNRYAKHPTIKTDDPEIAKRYRKAYDKIKAEFDDIFDEVQIHLQGWTSTIVLNELNREGYK